MCVSLIFFFIISEITANIYICGVCKQNPTFWHPEKKIFFLQNFHFGFLHNKYTIFLQPPKNLQFFIFSLKILRYISRFIWHLKTAICWILQQNPTCFYTFSNNIKNLNKFIYFTLILNFINHKKHILCIFYIFEISIQKIPWNQFWD